MPEILLLSCGVIVMGLVAALWWRTGLGKRLRMGAASLYYTRTVTAAEAKRVGHYILAQMGEMDARLNRGGQTYQIQLICSLGHPDEKQNIACEVLAAGLSDDVFAGGSVEVHICDNIFRETSVVVHRGRFGRRLVMNAAQLFYLEGVTGSQALDVATFLAGVGLFNNSPKIAQMNRGAEGYEFRLAVEVDPLTPAMAEGSRKMASDLSKQVLGGVPVEVSYCAGLIGTLRVVDPQAAEQGAENSYIARGPYRTEVFTVPGKPPQVNKTD